MRRIDEDEVLLPPPHPHPHPRPPAWFGDIIAAALVVAAAFAPFPSAEFRPDGPVALVVVLLPALILPARRRWPRAVLAACIACYGTAAALGTIAPGVMVAIAIAVFGVALRSARRSTLIAAAATVVAVTAINMVAMIGDALGPHTVQSAITIAFAAAAGDATRFRREYIREITDRALRAELTRESEAQRRVTEERLRIARDLHDAVAHQISVISLNAGVASASLETRPEKTREALASIRTASRLVLGEIGELLAMLRTVDGDGDLSVRPPQPGLDRLDELIDRFRDSGLEVRVRREGELSAVPVSVQRTAYRVVQEGLTNAHKHGAGQRAHVLLSVGPATLTVTVTNPVVPAPAAAAEGAEERTGLGLVGLRERVASIRGTVEAGPTPGGYRVAATLPLTKEETP